LSSANAAVLTFGFSGSVTQVPLDDVFGDIAAGDAIQGSFSFDSTAVDQIPGDSSTGSYSFSAPLGLLATVGTHDFSATGFLNIGVFNGVVDQYTVFATSAAGDVTLDLLLARISHQTFVKRLKYKWCRRFGILDVRNPLDV
jgi:hypothetical protein